MEQSLFIQFITKWFPGIVLGVVEKLNDTKNALTYLHKRLLRTDYSVTGKWESLSGTYTQVMADVVSMDSSLPLKKRDSIAKATGDIPKMGIELKLNERQLTDIGVLQAQNQGNTNQSVLLKKIFEDTPKVIRAVYERNEAIFLEALSTGVCVIDDTENVGTGFRVDYGYLTANKFGTTVVWSSASTAKPLDDIQRVIDKATDDGNTIIRCFMDKAAFNNMVKTTQFLDFFAFGLGYTGSLRTAPTLSQVNTLLTDKFGFVIEIVDRSVRYEKNGQQTSVKPWATGAVVFVCSEELGSLVYARLAEEDHPVAGVTYEKAEDYILVSKFRTNRPSLGEFTTSQARVIPVLSNVDQNYLLDSTTVQS